MAMVALASAGQPTQDELEEIKSISKELEEMNQLDWKLINHLIDNQQAICISKKVIVDGKEWKKDYMKKFLKGLSDINWEELYGLLEKYRTPIMNEILRDNRHVNVIDMLMKIERMKGVNWENYYKSYG